MTQILRQSTQIKVVIGPVVAVGDGFTPVTTLALGTADEAEIIKSDAAAVTDISAATFAAITSADGYYNLTLTTSHTDTVGLLTVLINDDSLCLPVKATFQVVEEAIYDAMFAASATGLLPANVTQWNSSAVATPTVAGVPEVDVTHWIGTAAATPSVAGVPEVDVTHVGGTLQTAGDLYASLGDVLDATTCWNGITSGAGTTTTLVDTALTQADTDYWVGQWVKFLDGVAAGQVRLITGFNPATDTITFAPATTQAIASGVAYIFIPAAMVDAKLANTTHGGPIADLELRDVAIGGTTDFTGAVVAANAGNQIKGIDSFTAAGKAELQAEANDAIVANRLDELLAADSDIDGAAPPTVGSVFHELMSKTAGSFTFDQTTDSMEALRDRGDAAWITATGFSTHSAADVWAAATRTLTAATNITSTGGTITVTSGGVTLANGVTHGGSTAILSLTRIIVAASGNNTAVQITGAGVGKGLGITGGDEGAGVAISSGLTDGNGVEIYSFAATPLYINDWTGASTGAIKLISNSGQGGVDGALLGLINGVAGTIQTLDALDTAQDSQHSTTQAKTNLITDIYHADINLCIDATNSRDEYTVTWFKNGVRQTSVTLGKIEVIKRADGTALIAADTAMTQIGSTGSWKYDASTVERTTAGEAVIVIVEATIDSAERSFSRVVMRDSTA